MHVVVGGGLNGLVAGHLLQDKGVRDVTIIDSASNPGGMFRSFHYQGQGYFDYGVHILQDTKYPSIEKIIRSALKPEDWHTLSGNDREIAGLYFNGRLQTNSAFLDLRDIQSETSNFLDHAIYKRLNSTSKQIVSDSSFSCHIRQKFGNLVAEKYIFPIVEKIYDHPAEHLHKIAATLTPFHRIVLFDERAMNDLMLSSKFREIYAYPDQRKLPIQYSSGLSSYYPKNFGLFRVIKSLIEQFKSKGGKMLTNSIVNSIEHRKNKVNSIELKAGSSLHKLSNIQSLIWTGSLPSVTKLLLGNEFLGSLPFDSPKKSVIVNIVLCEKPLIDDLYFFYSYLPNGHILRVSYPPNYCKTYPIKPNRFPLCVEALFDTLDGNIEKIIIQELEQMKIIRSDSVIFGSVEYITSGGFPMPTLKNANSIKQMRNSLDALEINNLYLCGSQCTPDLFYYRDLLRNTHDNILKVQ